MKRQWVHWEQLEEVAEGMWRSVPAAEREQYAKDAAELMRDVVRFSGAMRLALSRWPNSCRHNLTAANTNRLAWLGHAGCLLELGSPEDATRLGWHRLNDDEQRQANEAADSVVREYEGTVETCQKRLWE